jgi:hypothetical protein
MAYGRGFFSGRDNMANTGSGASQSIYGMGVGDLDFGPLRELCWRFLFRRDLDVVVYGLGDYWKYERGPAGSKLQKCAVAPNGQAASDFGGKGEFDRPWRHGANMKRIIRAANLELPKVAAMPAGNIRRRDKECRCGPLTASRATALCLGLTSSNVTQTDLNVRFFMGLWACSLDFTPR